MSELRLIADSGHRMEPIKDSWYTQNGGVPANLLSAFDYPIEAVCLICSRPIVAESLLEDWVHFSRD